MSDKKDEIYKMIKEYLSRTQKHYENEKILEIYNKCIEEFPTIIEEMTIENFIYLFQSHYFSLRRNADVDESITPEKQAKTIFNQLKKKKKYNIYFRLYNEYPSHNENRSLKISNRVRIMYFQKNSEILKTKIDHKKQTILKPNTIYLEFKTKGYFLTSNLIGHRSIMLSLKKELALVIYILQSFRVLKPSILISSRPAPGGICISCPETKDLIEVSGEPDLAYFLSKIDIINCNTIDEQEMKDKIQFIEKNIKPTHLENITNACYWSLKSEMEYDKDITESFVHLAVAFETIISMDGDKEETGGVTGKLVDRVTFLIGIDSQEREEIRVTMHDFYKTRSKIIHGKHFLFKAQDHNKLKSKLNKASMYFQRILIRELNLFSHTEEDI